MWAKNPHCRAIAAPAAAAQDLRQCQNRNLQMKIRSCFLRGVGVYVSISSTSYFNWNWFGSWWVSYGHGLQDDFVHSASLTCFLQFFMQNRLIFVFYGINTHNVNFITSDNVVQSSQLSSSKKFSFLQMETPHPLSSHSSIPPPSIPSNHISVLCLCEFAYSRYLK